MVFENLSSNCTLSRVLYFVLFEAHFEAFIFLFFYFFGFWNVNSSFTMCVDGAEWFCYKLVP